MDKRFDSSGESSLNAPMYCDRLLVYKKSAGQRKSFWTISEPTCKPNFLIAWKRPGHAAKLPFSQSPPHKTKKKRPQRRKRKEETFPLQDHFLRCKSSQREREREKDALHHPHISAVSKKKFLCFFLHKNSLTSNFAHLVVHFSPPDHVALLFYFFVLVFLR